MSGITFALTFYTFGEDNILILIFGLLFITSLLIICFSDIKYMIIPDEVLIVSSSIILLLKLFIKFNNEEILNLMDLGYVLIDILMSVGEVIGNLLKRLWDFISHTKAYNKAAKFMSNALSTIRDKLNEFALTKLADGYSLGMRFNKYGWDSDKAPTSGDFTVSNTKANNVNGSKDSIIFSICCIKGAIKAEK
jgi:hypothetical protein